MRCFYTTNEKNINIKWDMFDYDNSSIQLSLIKLGGESTAQTSIITLKHQLLYKCQLIFWIRRLHNIGKRIKFSLHTAINKNKSINLKTTILIPSYGNIFQYNGRFFSTI